MTEQIEGRRDPTVARTHLAAALQGIQPWDDQERADLAATLAWVYSGASLYRTQKPDLPATHLVSYFVVMDEGRGEMLLVAHRKAGLWLPSGGHVEPDEDPWQTVRRECREELHVPAVAATVIGDQPFFLTIAQTRGQGQHTDVSLWYVLRADADTVTSYDEEEFDAIRWLTPARILGEPLHTLDPNLHRFTRKLMNALPTVAQRAGR